MKKFLFIIAVCMASFAQAQNPIFYLLVGTYTNGGKSEGIYVYRFNPNRTEATLMSVAKGVENPSYLTVSKDEKFVYAVNENHGEKGGEISAFALDKAKGQLNFLNKQPVNGDDPCYVTVDSTGKNVITANYSGGNISVFKTNADGSLAAMVQQIAHDGYGINVQRQEMPHPHMADFAPGQKIVMVTDLGNDRVYTYNFDGNNATAPLSPADPAYTAVPDGSGPRHFCFHPNGKYMYVLNELSGNIIMYGYDKGKLTELQTIISDNSNTKGDKGSAEIAITPDGKFLYTSNRVTQNDIAMYKVASDGKLAENGHQAVGVHPRNFLIDPTGRFLLVASKDGNTIQIFVINKNFGILQDTGIKIDVPMPVCLKMVPVK